MELIAQLPLHAERLYASVLSGFHFLRPAWLATLPLWWLLVAWLARRSAAAGAWGTHIDAPLLQALRLPEPARFGGAARFRTGTSTSDPPSARHRTPWRWLLLAWTVATLALAGPTWEREPAVAYASPDSWVVVLDLSPSMAAIDLAPDRTTLARYAIDDLLQAANGAKVALVVFSDEAYAVTPLTDDVATVRGLTGPLVPDILPTRGDQLAPALAMAQQLLERAAASGGQVVVITDGFSDEAAATSAAGLLRARKSTVQVVAVGAAVGAAVGEPTTTAGRASVGVDTAAGRRSPMNPTAASNAPPDTPAPPDRAMLQRVASAGGGRVVELSGIAALATDLRSRARRNTATVADAPAARWRDVGSWLLPFVLLFAALLARRGWWAD